MSIIEQECIRVQVCKNQCASISACVCISVRVCVPACNYESSPGGGGVSWVWGSDGGGVQWGAGSHDGTGVCTAGGVLRGCLVIRPLRGAGRGQ